jgi:hypothetical protein
MNARSKKNKLSETKHVERVRASCIAELLL